MAKKVNSPKDRKGEERRVDIRIAAANEVRERSARGESNLRIKGNLANMPKAKSRARSDVDPAGVRRVVGGGLPTLGKGRR